MTAGPTFAEVVGRLGKEQFSRIPDAAYFEALAEVLRHAYAKRLDSVGDVEAESATSTTHITAVDRQGCIAALTTTLLSIFGSHYVLPGTGILMNNGVMWFDPRPGRPNSIAPSKRALTNMCPVVVARDGRPWFGIGASGGRRILGAVLQLASFIVDFGMDPEGAAHQPRVDVSGSDRIGIDYRLPAAIVERLSSQPGAALVEHTVHPDRFARPNLVLRGDDGLNCGISDVMSPWSAAIAEPDRA
jgi:gamma-glutamyltranspeptidase/glutathione hydrolase